MIKIRIDVMAVDFATANRLLKETIETGVDAISRTDGSTDVNCAECDDEDGEELDMLVYSKELKRIEVVE